MSPMPMACEGKQRPLSSRIAGRLPSAALATGLVLIVSGASPASADAPPTDHAAHHPAQTLQQATPVANQGLTYVPAYVAGQYPAPTDIPKTALATMPAPSLAAPSMSGGSMGSASGAGQMMAMMGEMSMPQPAFYPNLMAMPQVGPEQRLSLELQSRQSISAGAALMTDGLVQLSRRTADAVAIRKALDLVKQGTALTEAGLSGQRVLAGEAPQQVALGWFRRQMNMPSLVEANNQWVIYGLTPLHLTVMLTLILTSMTLMSAYIYRMGVAAQLVRRISVHMPHLPHRTHRASVAASDEPKPAAADANVPPVGLAASPDVDAKVVEAPNLPSEALPAVKPALPKATKFAFDPREMAEVVFSRSGKTVTVEPRERLFDAAERAGVEIGGSCQVGTCNGCKVRIVEGNILTEGEDEARFVKDAMVLACQSYPRGKVIVRA